MLEKILLLGNPALYQVADEVKEEELAQMKQVSDELHEVLIEFRKKYQAGRAIAAPQIGVQKRLVYMHIDHPVTMINPVLYDLSEEMMELWDDCLCFPNLLVKVRRHQQCKIDFWDLSWQKHTWTLDGDLSELLQHECDHLDGILATQRAIDEKSFAWR